MYYSFPRITVITPSFNQAVYLERTICSVLDQGYPNLEYIVIDGGSTDGSVDIIRRYADRLTWWISEPDQGQSCAINKGLRRATGEWVAWQNSDDIYYSGVFHDLAMTAKQRPHAGLIIGNMMLIQADDRPIRDICYVKPVYKGLLAEGMLLSNQAAFWRRSIHAQIGFLNEELICAFDYDWFLRLLQHTTGAHVDRIWGGFRLHSESKSNMLTQQFYEETNYIQTQHKISRWQKVWYKLRRIALMLSHGHVRYLFRGLLRYLRKQRGMLY